ncbi:MAG TPA: hypothetical protein VK196_07135 [Magnetospirillum sp.]|nr:hypothetical protein [Magnetospirillum sp.]
MAHPGIALPCCRFPLKAGLAAVVGLIAAVGVAAGAGALVWASDASLAPGLRLAVFPPVLTRVEAFRSIILGGAKPVSATAIPGVWLIHVEPDEAEDIRGALVTGAGPFARLASAACLTISEKKP